MAHSYKLDHLSIDLPSDDDDDDDDQFRTRLADHHNGWGKRGQEGTESWRRRRGALAHSSILHGALHLSCLVPRLKSSASTPPQPTNDRNYWDFVLCEKQMSHSSSCALLLHRLLDFFFSSRNSSPALVFARVSSKRNTGVCLLEFVS